MFVDEAELAIEITNLRERLQITKHQQKEIMQASIGQFENPRFLSERMHRLTASQFGAVIKRKEWISCDPLVKRILDRKSFFSPATAYGKANEAVAISFFEETTGKKVNPSGLFVDLEYGFLGASPDGKL